MFLKKHPILRLLLPLAGGIFMQWHLQAELFLWISILSAVFAAYIALSRASIYQKLRWSPLQGLLLMVSALAGGAILVFAHDVRNRQLWFGHEYRQGQLLTVTLTEDPVVKNRSYKAEAEVNYRADKNINHPVTGRILLYFKKDSLKQGLRAGDQIVFNRRLQPIKNNGNPGGFDYKRYCLFNGITHQVYLTDKDYQLLPDNRFPWYKRLLQHTRNHVLDAIRRNIKGKKEQGLAEAMLIGYKDDLDKALLQSYTNTGVVHVIAVSGMHLALLYWIVNLLLQPLLKRKATKWLHPAGVLLILWGFCFITGGAASIARAAVMFTFITVGTHLNRQVAIYNILGAAAFFQLCYNPYWLWDVGFQLSYMAVLSIVVFYRPVYNLLFVKNKILDGIWRLAAVSIAAQILTTPVAMYYFHQFPVYFLLNNLVVVPVSTLVLAGTLLLVILSPAKILASLVGNLLNGLIWWLNSFIEMMEGFPFALWSGIQINAFQGWLMLAIIAATVFWLVEKNKKGLWVAAAALLVFGTVRSFSFLQAERQKKLVVCDVGRHPALAFISGRKYILIAPPETLKDPPLNNYVIKPLEIFYRVQHADSLYDLSGAANTFLFGNKRILRIDAPVRKTSDTPIEVDLLILSGNPKIYMHTLSGLVSTRQVVIDGSVAAGKAGYWKQDCKALGIPCHDVSTDGAFVMNLY